MNRFRTFQFRMFLSFTVTLVVVIITVAGFYVYYIYSQAREALSNNMDQLAINIASVVDVEIRQLSLVSERVVFSQQLREAIINELPYADGAARYRITTNLNSLLYSICGPKLTFYHMNIITLDGHQYEFGREFRYIRLADSTKSIPWFQEALRLDGKPLIVPLHTSTTNRIPMEVISVSRAFGLDFGRPPKAVVEIQRDYAHFANLIERTSYIANTLVRSFAVFILDRNGELIYPILLSDEMLYHYNSVIQSGWDYGNNGETVINPNTGERELLFISVGEFSRWNVIVKLGESYFEESVRLAWLHTSIIGVILIIISAFVSFYLSRKFTVPLAQLRSNIQSLSLDSLQIQDGWNVDSNVDELKQLGNAFEIMTRRLNDSLEEMVVLKNAEIHAKMSALQSQMNPHFLYNTLAVISIMAEEGDTKNVQWACNNLSSMLEYVTGNTLSKVTFRKELEHTQNYIDLIKIRYMNDIVFSCDVPDEILDIEIPKLVIQPLIENSVKYITKKPPKWNISVSARISDGVWRVTVTDNGNGFEPDILDELKENMKMIFEGGEIPSLSINGMGILNIYIRLYFSYHHDMIFEIDSIPGIGVSITIGGRIM